jgi:hypothetical protein
MFRQRTGRCFDLEQRNEENRHLHSFQANLERLVLIVHQIKKGVGYGYQSC